MRNEAERHCPSCGKRIVAGRTDKRYCDDICRARDTRKRNKEEVISGYQDAHKAVISAIKRNYSLLKKAIDQREEWIVDYAVLYFKGFNPRFFTSSLVTENGHTRYYCFEIGWEDLGESRFRVTVDTERLKVFRPDETGDIGF